MGPRVLSRPPEVPQGDRSSWVRSRWPDAKIEGAGAKCDLRNEQQREKREQRRERREKREESREGRREGTEKVRPQGGKRQESRAKSKDRREKSERREKREERRENIATSLIHCMFTVSCDHLEKVM